MSLNPLSCSGGSNPHKGEEAGRGGGSIDYWPKQSPEALRTALTMVLIGNSHRNRRRIDQICSFGCGESVGSFCKEGGQVGLTWKAAMMGIAPAPMTAALLAWPQCTFCNLDIDGGSITAEEESNTGTEDQINVPAVVSRLETEQAPLCYTS